jgi:YD repeat-containing protein
MTSEREAGTHLVTATVDAMNRRTEFTYDAKANVTQVKRLAVTPNAVSTASSAWAA